MVNDYFASITHNNIITCSICPITENDYINYTIIGKVLISLSVNSPVF